MCIFYRFSTCLRSKLEVCSNKLTARVGGCPNEDMKVSSAPSFGGPGGHIFDVVAQVVKNHVFTAMLAVRGLV